MNEPLKRCSRNDRHDAHVYAYKMGDAQTSYRCPGYLGDADALDKTAGQRRAEAREEALANVRTLTNEAVRIMLHSGWASDKSMELNVRFRVALVEANATAALAYAISEAGGDLEVALSRIAATLERGVSLVHE